MKARYYRNNDVLDARRGFDPSLAWRSIWGAKNILLESLAWRIGTGSAINVKRDNWIVVEGHVERPIFLNDDDTDFEVWNLIDHDGRTWKTDYLRSLFDNTTVNNILTIPIAPSVQDDKLFWRLSKDGNYTVKSGYWLGMRDHQEIVTNDHSSLWKKIWGSHWPPKLKHFLWRACNNSLPVNEVRHYRHMTDSPICSRNCAENETVCHALLDCHKVRHVWQNHPLFHLIRDAPRNSFLDLLQWIIAHCSNDDLAYVCSTMWAAWFCRNKEVMAGTTCDANLTAVSFAKLLSDYQNYTQKISVYHPPRVLSFQQWKPPLEGWIKINFNAHVGMTLRRGLGVIIRDHNGKALLTGTKYVEANWNVHISEAAAALFALEIARRMGYEYIHLEGDSLLVIKAITQEEQGSTHIHLLLDKIVELANTFNGFVSSFVRRNGNTVAHMIARWHTGDAQEKICMDPFPPSLLTLVELDLA